MKFELIIEDEEIIQDVKHLLNLMPKNKIQIHTYENNSPSENHTPALGTYRLGKKLDKMNIRDFAYED